MSYGNADTQHKHLTNALVAACDTSEPQASSNVSPRFRNASFDSTRALGLVIHNPAHMRAVCNIAKRSLHTPFEVDALNQELYTLADSLGVDQAVAVDMLGMAAAGKKRELSPQVVADIQQANRSFEPNL